MGQGSTLLPMKSLNALAVQPAAQPLVKWSGGKRAELGRIAAAMPGPISRLIEPFVGGGAVLFATPSHIPAEANDACADLVGLYRQAQQPAALAGALGAIDAAWQAIGRVPAGAADVADRIAAAAGPLAGLDAALPRAVAREAARALARKRAALAGFAAAGDAGDPAALLASALKAALYTALRGAADDLPPGPARAAAFWFVRDFCYGAMSRRNAAGRCNVPYGGLSYDARRPAARLAQLAQPATRARLAATRFSCGDFVPFLERVRPGPGDFVFLDPPYDSPFSAYEGAAFGRPDHQRLAAMLAGLPCPWMLVIGETDFVRQTYCSLPDARTAEFAKTYATNIKSRFSRAAVHLVVTNYSACSNSERDTVTIAMAA